MFKWWVLIFVFSVSCKSSKISNYDGWGGIKHANHQEIIQTSTETIEFGQKAAVESIDKLKPNSCVQINSKDVSNLKVSKGKLKRPTIKIRVKKLSKAHSKKALPDVSKFFITYNMLMDLGAVLFTIGISVLSIFGVAAGSGSGASSTAPGSSTVGSSPVVIVVSCLGLMALGLIFWFAGLFYFKHFQKNKKKK
jgi:hypothetical protein